MRRPTIQTLLVVLAGALSAVGAADPADTHPQLHLIPWPKSVKASNGYLPLSAEVRIVAEDERLLPLAKVLAVELELLTDLRLVTLAADKGRTGDIVLRIDPQLRADQPILSVRQRELVRTTDGAHTIDIAEQAVLSGFDYRATAEGTSTLLQLVGRTASGTGVVAP